MNINLPIQIKNMLATEEVRAYHHLWHLVRNESNWNNLTPAQKAQLGPDWVAPRFEGKANAGLDFLFMHREMIKMVNNHLHHLSDPTYTKVEGWNPIPFAANDATWPMPLIWPNAHEAFDWAKNLNTAAYYKKRVNDEFRSDTWLKSISLDKLGTELETSVHGWMHLRWSDTPPANLWDNSVNNDWLGAPYSSHVNNHFWKLHGFIDETITAWENANNKLADLSSAWAGPNGFLPTMKHTADPELLTKMEVRSKPIKLMTWHVPIIEGVTDKEMIVTHM
ncbi:MAG: hypothetical protein ACI837_002113 [Crocinitomicaceae bacterium]|jgi:hypothetical protein